MAHRLAPLAAAITTSALAATALALPAAAAAPPAPPAPVQVVAEGLDDPYGLGYANGKFYTAENLSGEISGIIPGGRGPSTRVSGYPGVTGVDRTRRELLFLTGESQDPEAEGGSTLYVSTPGGPVRALADLKAHELEHNPDGQRQFGDDGAPLDALSNPFSVVAAEGAAARAGTFAFVADAGANAVLAVDRAGHVRTFYVPPLVTTGSCEGQENNDPAHVGCDSVPTGVAQGPDGTLAVSTLSAEAEGEGRVYLLDPVTAQVRRVISGFTSPTGVAVGPEGEVYASEIFEGAPEGDEVPPGFDPSTVGQVVRVDPDGHRTRAQVTLPAGLTWARGALHATAWSIAGAAGLGEHAGQVVRVDASAFEHAH